MNDIIMLANLLDGPKHGYALKKRAGLISGAAAMHNNIVYPLLRRFVAQGWVTQRRANGERGQTRQVYSLTPQGRRALIERLKKFDENERRSAEALYLRVGLFDVLDASTRENILAKREEYLAAREERLRGIEGAMELNGYPAEVVRFLREQIRAERGWIARLRQLSADSKREKKGGGRHGERR
jgi:DNA-binding PadR family transcriptional regulator